MTRRRQPFSLFKRGDYYYFKIWDSDLRQYTTHRSTGEKNKNRAAVVASRMIDEGIVPAAASPIAVDYIIDRIEKSGNSEKYKREGVRYIDKYCRMSPEFSRLKLSDVQGKHLNKLVDFLSGHVTGRMANRIMNYIKPALKSAHLRGYIPRDPTAGKVERAPEQARRRGVLTADEIRMVIASPPARDPRFRPYIVTAILTGMRKGELRALKWSDVDTERGIISVRQSYTDTDGTTAPKTDDSARDILILSPVAAALRDLRGSSPYTAPDDYVFYQDSRFRPAPSHFADKAFASVLDGIGIDSAQRAARHLVPHSMRHTFVTFCRSLLPDFVTGTMSGHTTAQMIDNYGRPTADHYRTARAVLEGELKIN